MSIHLPVALRRRSWISFGLTVLLPLGACRQVQLDVPKQPDRTATYAFVDVAVVPMDTPRVLTGQTVLVKADRIVSIGPVGAVPIDAGVTVIDGAGRFLLPGLSDMHVHVWDEHELPLYVANGVTTVRNMWGESSTLAMRTRVAAGEIPGPTIVTAGPIIDGVPPIWQGSTVATTAAGGERLALEHKAAGYDFIKVYSNLAPAVFDAIAATATAQGIAFAGHVPRSVPLEHALRSGMASIEHLTGYTEATLKEGVSLGEGPRSQERFEIGRRLAARTLSHSEVFDDEKRRALARLTALTGVWNTPTLIVRKNAGLTRAMAEAALQRPELQFLSPSVQRGWQPPRRSDEDQRALQSFFENEVATVTELHRAGARLLAGTDAPNPHVLHGFAIHEELALLVQAGLTPFEAIATATVNPARFFGSPAELGSVRQGARADLILLEANPLVDVSNLKRRVGVMLRGRWLPEAELQGMLKSVAAYYEQGPDWFADEPPVAVTAGAEVVFRGEFASLFRGREIGAERLAWVGLPAGGRAVVSQARNGSGGRSTRSSYRLERAADGSLLRFTFEQSGQFSNRRGVLERNGDRYELKLPGRDAQRIDVGQDDLVLSGTLGDWFFLADRLDDLAVGATRKLTVWSIVTLPEDRLYRQSWTIVRKPDFADAVRAAVDAAKRFDVEVSSGRSSQAFTVSIDPESRSPLRIEYPELSVQRTE